jgi:RNase P subunit RPR2
MVCDKYCQRCKTIQSFKLNPNSVRFITDLNGWFSFTCPKCGWTGNFQIDRMTLEKVIKENEQK